MYEIGLSTYHFPGYLGQVILMGKNHPDCEIKLLGAEWTGVIML